MKISIVIPVLNEATVISSTLEKVFSLDGDYEMIVVDGGSTDATLAKAVQCAEHCTRPVSVLSAPAGRAMQMNFGARRANGDVLLFLHADTVLPRSALADISKCLDSPAVVGGRFKVTLDQDGWRYRTIAGCINLRDRVFRGFTGDQAIFVRRQVFDSIGGYREIALMEDLDLARRICRVGKAVQLSSRVTTSARRWQKNGIVRTILLMWCLRMLYVLGYPPSKLKRLYGDTR